MTLVTFKDSPLRRPCIVVIVWQQYSGSSTLLLSPVQSKTTQLNVELSKLELRCIDPGLAMDAPDFRYL